MNLSVSNLAWEIKDNDLVLPILKKNNIHRIEGVLTKISEWKNLTNDKLHIFLNNLRFNNIEISSIQSIFYGLDISLDDIEQVLNHIIRLLEICEILSINILVFGSPNLRKYNINHKNNLPELFKKIDKLMVESKVTFIIEPNSSIYGGDYFFTVKEIVGFIKNNNLINIKTMIDTHNSILENQDPCMEFIEYEDYIDHIHISELELNPIKVSTKHKKFSFLLKDKKYNKIITYEVLNKNNTLKSVEIFNTLYNI